MLQVMTTSDKNKNMAEQLEFDFMKKHTVREGQCTRCGRLAWEWAEGCLLPRVRGKFTVDGRYV